MFNISDLMIRSTTTMVITPITMTTTADDITAVTGVSSVWGNAEI